VFLRDMVCLRNICVDTLHKGDIEDDDDNNDYNDDDNDDDDDDDNNNNNYRKQPYWALHTYFGKC
jgi:hypothetical protein